MENLTQTYFEETFGYLVSPDPPKEPVVETETYYPYLQCPYCLYGSYSLKQFIILGKKGNISKKMALCPKCHNTLRRKTLIDIGKSDWMQYAYWLASSAQWDVNKRIKWNMIFEAMKPLSQTLVTEFWNTYRKEKARIDPFYAAKLAEKEAEKAADEYMRDNEIKYNMSYEEYSEKQNK